MIQMVSIPDFPPNILDFSPNIPDCSSNRISYRIFPPNYAGFFSPKSGCVYSTVLDCSVARTQAWFLKNMIIGYPRRRSTRKATKSHLQTIRIFLQIYQFFLQIIPDFSPNFSVAGCHITDVILDFFSIYHTFLQKSSNRLDCAGLLPHVPAAYVGRTTRLDDLEELMRRRSLPQGGDGLRV
jgi:hypothetical protein